ncbi:MAG: acyclic terpene utilization AtuA family protein, partial [Rhodospirillales bacterium]
MLDHVQTEKVSSAGIGEISMVAMTGCLGYGFTEQAFQRALDAGMDFIGCDAGSMDPGPYYLGEGIPFVSREASKRDLSIMLEGAIAHGIPLLIGTSGGGGGEPHLAFTRQLVEEIAAEKGLHFKMAMVHSELGQNYLLKKVRAGKVRPLGPIGELTEDDVRNTHRVVAMMGVEPYHEALKAGAQVILAGRSSDAAIYAAIPT